MKKALLLVIVALMFIPVAAFADNPLDTTAGTIVTAEGYQNVLRYSDSGGAPKANIITTTIEVTVAAMYGFDPLANNSDLTKTTPGVGVTYAYFITNEGNASFDGTNKLTVNMKATGIGTTIGNWTLYVTEEGSGTVLSSSINTPITLSDLAEDASRWIYVTVLPPSAQAQALNGSYVVMTLEANTTATPAGVYYGANGITYGGTFESTDLTITSIETSVMRMTRIATVDAPVGPDGKFSGDPHAAVPGAVITYTITVTNEGGGVATSVEVVDKVPTRETTAAHISATGSQIGTNVTISAANALDNGWTAYYSKASSPNMTYGYIGTDWITVDAGSLITGKSLTQETGVTYVKFEYTGNSGRLAGGTADMTLTWGVTIR